MIRLISLILVAMCAAGCAQDNSDNTIKVTDPNGPGPNPKPSNTLHRHVMLTLAGWADLYSILKLVSTNENQIGCISKTENAIRWNCPLRDLGNIGRAGEAGIVRGNGVIKIMTGPLGLANYVTRGAHVLRAPQDYEITLVPTGTGYRFQFESSMEVPAGHSRDSVYHRFDWDLNGQVNIEAGQWRLTQAEGSLTVLKFSRAGQGGQEVQFRMDSSETLQWSGCGTLNGKFNFSGEKQDLTPVLSDPEKGVRSEMGGKGHSYLECVQKQSSVYGLALTAPFWAQPAP